MKIFTDHLTLDQQEVVEAIMIMNGYRWCLTKTRLNGGKLIGISVRNNTLFVIHPSVRDTTHLEELEPPDLSELTATKTYPYKFYLRGVEIPIPRLEL